MPNFQRQKSIDNFIADFYCRKAKLIIEIDGAEHFTEEGRIKDALRTEILEKYGLTVIRFTNRQTDKNFNAVCEEIDKTVKAKIQNN
jgi:very-short-patch-repair endonuclease